MSNGIKTILYIVGTFLIIWLVFGFVATILPWLIIAGVVIYIVVKIKGAILNKKANRNDSYDTQYTETYSESYNSDAFEASRDDNNTSVIDVDYKEVD